MKTSQAIKELLIRKGITPTGNRKKDMILAKSVMPAPYKEFKKTWAKTKAMKVIY